jgi:hypothetical protein
MINIYTIQFNDADFLHYQFVTFKKFLKAEHKLICVNNAFDNIAEKEAIERKARELGLDYLVPPTDIRQGGHAHQTALNWIWKNYIAGSNDINIIVDHDMFPIKEFVCDPQYDICGINQERIGQGGENIHYFHPGFMIINNTLKDRETVDFVGEKIHGVDCDSGGNWHHYMTAHPELKIKYYKIVNICEEHNNRGLLEVFNNNNYNEADPFQLCDDFVIHFRNGSNWAHTDKNLYNLKKHQLLTILNRQMEL